MKKLAVPAIVTVVVLALAACGGSDENATQVDDAEAATQKLSFVASADSGLAYTVNSETAAARPTTLEIVNEQSVPHDVVLEDANGEEVGATDVVTEDTSSAEVDLEPGTYKFFCSVPGHREAGMEGTLTVK